MHRGKQRQRRQERAVAASAVSAPAAAAASSSSASTAAPTTTTTSGAATVKGSIEATLLSAATATAGGAIAATPAALTALERCHSLFVASVADELVRQVAAAGGGRGGKSGIVRHRPDDVRAAVRRMLTEGCSATTANEASEDEQDRFWDEVLASCRHMDAAEANDVDEDEIGSYDNAGVVQDDDRKRSPPSERKGRTAKKPAATKRKSEPSSAASAAKPASTAIRAKKKKKRKGNKVGWTQEELEAQERLLEQSKLKMMSGE